MGGMENSGLAAHSPFSRARTPCTHGTEHADEGQPGLNCLRGTLLKKATGEGTEGGEQAAKRSAGGEGDGPCHGGHVGCSVEELTLENHLDKGKWLAKQEVPRAPAA